MLARSCRKPSSNHLLSHWGMMEIVIIIPQLRQKWMLKNHSWNMQKYLQDRDCLHCTECENVNGGIDTFIDYLFLYLMNPHLFPRQKNQDLKLFSSPFPSLPICIFLPISSFFSKLTVVITGSLWYLVNYLWSQYTVVCQHVIDFFSVWGQR